MCVPRHASCHKRAALQHQDQLIMAFAARAHLQLYRRPAPLACVALSLALHASTALLPSTLYPHRPRYRPRSRTQSRANLCLLGRVLPASLPSDGLRVYLPEAKYAAAAYCTHSQPSRPPSRKDPFPSMCCTARSCCALCAHAHHPLTALSRVRPRHHGSCDLL